jgi:ATP-dependent RNA helicase RhlE
MFSATFSGEIKKLANTLLKDPVLIEVARQNSIAELITHVVYPVSRIRKRELLTYLIKSQDLKQVLVFVRTKHGASRLAQQLERDEITATAIHGDKSQPQRTQALAEFKEGVASVLVATDVAARGLDIEDLPHVVNFELPTTPEDYIHRIGRTGRAGTKGDAISLVCEDEQELLDGIEKLLKFKINSRVIPGFEADIKLDQRGESHRGQVRDAYPGEAAQPGQKKPAAPHRARAEKNTSQFPLDGGQPSPDRAELKSYRARPGTSGGKRKGTEDPLFTQPYIPSSTSSLAPSIPSPTDSHSHYQRPGRQNKPLAALFRPRQPAKPKQDGS